MAKASDTSEAKAPNKFQLRRAQTRKDLLQLGHDRFRFKGYGATTVEDLVTDSGYTRGAFYFHFEGKDEFFIEVLRDRQHIRGEWWTIIDSPEVTDLTSALMASAVVFEKTDPDGGAWTLLIAEFVDANRENTSFLNQLRELYDEWIEEFALFVTPMQERGWCRADISATEISARVLAVTEGYSVHHRLYSADPTPFLDTIVRMLKPA